MMLIPEWKRAYRYWSVVAAAGLAVLDVAYEYLPVVQTYLPEGWARWFALVIIAARILQQKPKGG